MPSLLSLLCSLLILFSFNTTILEAAQANESEIDRWALLCFRYGVHYYPLHILNSWRADSLNFCGWKGVTCSTKFPPRVVSLNVTSARLGGKISGCVVNLTFLSSMNLADNDLSGTIPEELGKLPNLHTLNLAGNSLGDNIPDSIGTSNSLSYVNLANNSLTGGIPLSWANCSSLSTLILSRNNLSGVIPSPLFDNSSKLFMVDLQINSFTGLIPHFRNVTTLKFLCLTENFLSGSIPPTIGNVSSLTSILLGQNRLSGLIPETLSHITKLFELDLSFNSLSGSVPLSLYNMTSLKYFSVGSNALVGQIPSHIGYSLPNLQSLILGSNRLEGLIPTSIANMLNLQVLDLSNNSLHGSVPSLGSLANLRQLILGKNLLEAYDWSFLTSLASCTQLTKLSLEGNALKGSLPIAVVNLSTTLGDLSLASNQISGSIPAEISNLVNLTSLRMESNFLSGSIPSTIGKLQYLYILSLSNNKLSGLIPPSVGDITQLGKLYLSDNKLTGNIPGSLGLCKGLLELNLSRNNLNGSIPVELFANPPFSLGLDFSHNNLTGELPLELGTHGVGDGPTSLHMEVNKFHGQIPARWQLASTLQINLSHNELSGVVPELFGYLPMLEQLDLSYNNLEGAIPTSGIFENSTAVVLGGNKGLCSNSSRLALPICHGISSSGTKTKHHLSLMATLLLIVLPPLTIASLVLLWFSPALWKRAVFLFFQLAVVSKKMFRFVTHHKRREVHTAPRNDEKKLKRVSYQDILKATNWLSSLHTISSTSTGSVYVGRFKSDRRLVAIKVFNLSEPSGSDSYCIECEVLRNTRHRNIMCPVTICSTLDSQNHEFKALIFKFMVNGSLDRWLHSEQHNGIPGRALNFGQRICIEADVASALDYVHNQLTPPLIHCDLKPENILLDDDMTARLSDFGSAKFLSPDMFIPESLDDVGGTVGYMAPGEFSFSIST
uniref:Protein kinase domain-containing protein n=1 Tax=Aegilops tauschii subsp. strangulata TaxID=200361 RepID=A0A453AGK5_AEGTS